MKNMLHLEALFSTLLFEQIDLQLQKEMDEEIITHICNLDALKALRRTWSMLKFDAFHALLPPFFALLSFAPLHTKR